VEVKRSNGEAIALAGSPIRMSETPPRTPAAPPPLGQDTDAVLQELLDASAAELTEWRAAGAI